MKKKKHLLFYSYIFFIIISITSIVVLYVLRSNFEDVRMLKQIVAGIHVFSILLLTIISLLDVMKLNLFHKLISISIFCVTFLLSVLYAFFYLIYKPII